MRRYPFSKILNMRDIGGYPVPEGETSFGKFFRSAMPEGFSEIDHALLEKLHITDVIDLRGTEEVQKKPNAFSGVTGVAVHNIPFMEKIEDYPKSDDFVPHSYLKVAESPNMLRVLQVLLHAKGAALFHCTAGKDRTGTTAALLELLAGVDDTDIVGDYILSQAYMWEQLEQFAKECPQFPMALIFPKAENMLGFLRLFHHKYKTPTAYFQKIGLSNLECEALKCKLISVE